MIAPIDGVGGFHAGRSEAFARQRKIGIAYAEGVMTFPERTGDSCRTLCSRERRTRNREQRKVLTSAVEQHLVTHPGNHTEPEHLGVKALSTLKVSDFETEMIEPLELHVRS